MELIDNKMFSRGPFESGPHPVCRLRRACMEDAPRITGLLDELYQGAYPLAADTAIAHEISDPAVGLWAIAEAPDTGQLVATMGFHIDGVARIGWSGGGAVRPGYRGGALAATLLRYGIERLAGPEGPVDVIFGTSRTATEGPARMVERAGYVPVGFLPNAMRILGRLEHLHLDAYLTRRALAAERPAPRLLPAVLPVYQAVAAQLGLPPALVLDATGSSVPPPVAPLRGFHLETDPVEVARHAARLRPAGATDIFKPFQQPNAVLHRPGSADAVLLRSGGPGMPASILGLAPYHETPGALLATACEELRRGGAIFVDLWVDAGATPCQAAALSAGLIACGYFPALCRTGDGGRRDAVILSRTFVPISLAGVSINRRALPLLRAYLDARGAGVPGAPDPLDTAALGMVKGRA